MSALVLAALITALCGVFTALIARLPIFKKNLVKKVDLSAILLEERKQFAKEQEALIRFITEQLTACEAKSNSLQMLVFQNQAQMHSQQMEIFELKAQVIKLQNPTGA